jgi:hypothetical protein
MNLLNNKYGCWIVNGVPFKNKFEALFYSNQIGSLGARFYFHDHIWQNFDRRLLGKVPLTTLYKERAQQLRDKYNYLVLHYSGGSDSHNILDTFITNNIKLDEIYVRWAKPLIDGKFYTPNLHDLSARNSASEWDFTIKPVLDKLKSSNPEIKINVVDFTDKFNKSYSVETIENRIVEMGMYRGALGSVAQRLDKSYEENITESKSSNIGHIFGVEKPNVVQEKNTIYMRFYDFAIESALMPNLMQEESVELFYWAHDMPLLPMEQAYQVGKFLSKNHKELVSPDYTSRTIALRTQLDKKFNIEKSILYKNSWDFKKFQVGKPNDARSDWWHWVHESPELSSIQTGFKIAMNNITSKIDQRMLINAEGASVLQTCKTASIKITDV